MRAGGTALDGPAPLRWWQYIGPWPVRPLQVTLFAALFFAFTAAASAVLENEIVVNVTFTEQILSVIAGSVVAWALLWASQRWQARHGLNLPGYLLVFLITSTVAVIVRTYVGGVDDLLFSSPSAFISTILRIAIPLLALNSIIGVTTGRLQHQVARTEDALSLARVQQEWLLEADERARRQVADTLHDRVQAALIAACLQLQTVDPADRQGIDRVIDRLEELRKVDVRRAARALSPTLSEVGLASSLSELASQYEPGMVTLVDVDARLDTKGRTEERTRLGIYRIAEQALLNAAVHGRAQVCHISVTYDDSATVEIDDNGTGFIPAAVDQPEAAVSGSGAALISTWVRALGGEWEWGNRPEGGARVLVRLPKPPESHL